MTREEQAAEARRRVRWHRDQSATPTQTARVWRMDEDHLGYTHTRCGRHFGRFVDPAQTTDHAVEHDKTCEEARRA